MKAFVTFLGCQQISQSIGSAGGAGSWLVARLHFTLSPLSGGLFFLTTEIRQNHDFDYFDSELPIEVSKPTGTYEGPWHHESFSKAAEQYFRRCIGPGGVISIDNNSVGNMFVGNTFGSNPGNQIQMKNSSGNLFVGNHFGAASKKSAPVEKYTIEIPDKAVGPW